MKNFTQSLNCFQEFNKLISKNKHDKSFKITILGFFDLNEVYPDSLQKDRNL